MKLFCWTRCKVLENVSLWSWLLAWSCPSIYGLISCNHCEEISNIIYCMLGCWQSIQCWRCVWFLRWVDKLAYIIFILLDFYGKMTKVKTIAFDLGEVVWRFFGIGSGKFIYVNMEHVVTEVICWVHVVFLYMVNSPWIGWIPPWSAGTPL